MGNIKPRKLAPPKEAPKLVWSSQKNKWIYEDEVEEELSKVVFSPSLQCYVFHCGVYGEDFSNVDM